MTGEYWRNRVTAAAVESHIFIPIVTKEYFKSTVCLDELNTFREKAPPNELRNTVMPLVLAGHRLLEPESSQEEIRFIESLHHQDLGKARLQGYNLPPWDNLVWRLVQDIQAWHFGYSARQNARQNVDQLEAQVKSGRVLSALRMNRPASGLSDA